MKKYLIAGLLLFFSTAAFAQTGEINEKLEMSTMPAETIIVNFDFNSALVGDVARLDIKEFVEKNLNVLPYKSIVLAGYTDATLKERSHQSLIEERVKNVENYLLILGVDKSKIHHYIDANPAKPIVAQNPNRTNRKELQKNRRVEIWVYR
jgi:outer membrane protein OmpA-like peptidoglycan-associated protein